MDPIDLEQSVADLALLSRQAVTAAQLASELLEREPPKTWEESMLK